MNFLEALWVSKLREVELRERLSPVQDHPADEIDGEILEHARALGYRSNHIENMGAEVAELLCRANGVPDGEPWHGFAVICGEPPWQYLAVLEPGRVLKGPHLTTSYALEHVRVVVIPARRLFRVELAEDAPGPPGPFPSPEPTHPTQDDTHDG
jgi:hypothetical protein